MTIQECYLQLDGDYEEVLRRLHDEKRIQKFALRFLDDRNYKNLCEAMEAEEYEKAFRAAHTMKGMCATLGFGRLFASSNALTESLRDGKGEASDRLYKEVKQDYCHTIAVLKEYQKQQLQ